MATETFVGALATVPDPPWDHFLGTVERNGSGAARANTVGGDAYVAHDSATSTTAHKSKITVGAASGGPGGSDYHQIVVRAQGADGTAGGYAAYVEAGSTTVNIDRLINNAYTSLTTRTLGAALVTGDTLELEVDGSTPPTLTLRKNGTQVGATFTDSGGTYPTGTRCGFGFFSNPITNVTITQWDGSDVGAPATKAPPFNLSRPRFYTSRRRIV